MLVFSEKSIAIKVRLKHIRIKIIYFNLIIQLIYIQISNRH